MDRLRYPIGPFRLEKEVSPGQLKAWIDDIESVPRALRQAVEGLSDEQLDTPYRPGGWTVRQVAHHVADGQMNGYIRFKWALTEEKPLIKMYDEQTWADLPDGKLAPLEHTLAFVDALHARWALLLRSLTPEQFQRSYLHPESGEMRLDQATGLYAWHGLHHVAHITSLRERMGW